MKLTKEIILWIIFGKKDKMYPYWLRSIFILLWFWSLTNIPLFIFKVISFKLFILPFTLTIGCSIILGFIWFLIDLIQHRKNIKNDLNKKINKITGK